MESCTADFLVQGYGLNALPFNPRYVPFPQKGRVWEKGPISFGQNIKVNIMKKTITAVLSLLLVASSFSQDYSFRIEKFGQGDPIILIPGLSSSGEVWNETVQELSGQHECHVLTLPGFAGQPPVERENYLKEVGDEILSYIEDKQLNNTTLIGHSLGGFLSLYLGIQNNPRIARLIVVDGLPYFGASQNPSATPESMKSMAEMMKNNIQRQTPEQFELMQPAILGTMISDPERIQEAMEWGRQSDPNTVGQAMYELYQNDLREEMGLIHIPTLVLGSWAGYKDYGVTREMIQRSFDLQFSSLKTKRIVLSDTGKHFLMWDDPQWYIGEVKAFLSTGYNK